MDDDIQDILASISAPSISERTRDLQALTRAWVNERTAPELLPYPTSLVERTTDRIKRQVSEIAMFAWNSPHRRSVDRNHRRNDRPHGPEIELHSCHLADRT